MENDTRPDVTKKATEVDFGNMTPRENMMAILNGEQPDFYGDFMGAMDMIPDPIMMESLTKPDGSIVYDAWGVAFTQGPGEPGAMPLAGEYAVITDIEEWESQVKVPSVEGYDWSQTIAMAEQVDRKRKFVGYMCTAGLFERSHHLQGMSEAFINYMEYPEEMAALLRVIADYKIAQIRKAAEMFHPDVIFYQDDWGSKDNEFLPPYLWRELIKPLQTEIAQVIHECGMLYVHHSDSYCQHLVQDMIDIGIDIWQGVIPSNDIVAIQKETNGQLPMIGGIDGAALDMEGVPEDVIRAEVRRAIDTYCPGGKFFPALAYGSLFIERNNAILNDELKNYGRQWALEHPIS